MTPRLADAVEDGYRAFAGHGIGKRLHVCRCPVCFGDDTRFERALVTTPLRAIPADLLAEYTNSAHAWSDEMRYFLPRYLDLIAAGEAPCHSGMEYALSRLSYADWRGTWPEAERRVLEAFFAALLADRLHGPGLEVRVWLWVEPNDSFYDRTSLPEVFALVANAGGDVEPLLGEFDATRGRLPDLHLAAIVNMTAMDLARTRLDRSFSSLRGPAEDRIVAWLLRPETAERMEAAFFAATDPLDQQTFSNAAAMLRTP